MKEYTKLDRCPKCEYDDIRTFWTEGRTWENFCDNCGWTSERMIPPMGTICTTRTYSGGWNYTMYDKYNQPCVYSASYSNENEIMKEILRTLRFTEEDEYYGKCTVVIFPAGETEGYIYEEDLYS